MTIKTVITSGISKKMNAEDAFNNFVIGCIYRHLSGDWGEVSEDDALLNKSDPMYAMSVYTSSDGVKIWLKQDYKILTVMFPSEY